MNKNKNNFVCVNDVVILGFALAPFNLKQLLEISIGFRLNEEDLIEFKFQLLWNWDK